MEPFVSAYLSLDHVRPVLTQVQHHVKDVDSGVADIVIIHKLHQVVKSDIGACPTYSGTEKYVGVYFIPVSKY